MKKNILTLTVVSLIDFVYLNGSMISYICRGGQPVLHSIIYTGDASQNVQLRLPGE